MFIPISVTSMTDNKGNIKPVYAQLQDVIYKIDRVNKFENEMFAGIASILYYCDATSSDETVGLELKYFIEDHRWVLVKIIK